MVYQKVFKHGTSLVVVIPAQMRREFGIQRGDYLALELKDDQTIEIRPVIKREPILNWRDRMEKLTQSPSSLSIDNS